MLIAIEGCCHGELDKIYETLEFIEKEHGKKVDLLICCGDFQAIRNVFDLSCMAVPPKFLQMQTFYKYYSGEKTAPVLTIFVGGNHEASNYLQELSYGGWVAPNIYFLGNAGVINFGGLRIAGISGIYKSHDYLKGHFEIPPYSESSKRSVYHVRQLEIFRLKQISNPLDIFVSHDWPVGVVEHGDVDSLLRYKPFFREDIESGHLGNPCLWDLLKKLKPSSWFSGHLHCKFAACVPHEDGSDTKFLALDKCVPGKRFLQILEIPNKSESPFDLSLDAEWLGILKDTNHLWHFDNSIHYLPGPGGQEKFDFRQSEGDVRKIGELFGDLRIDPDLFQRTAPLHEASYGEGNLNQITRNMEQKGIPLPPVKCYINPQTTWICEKLEIVDPMKRLMEKNAAEKKSCSVDFLMVGVGETSAEGETGKQENPDEIDLGGEEDIPERDETDLDALNVKKIRLDEGWNVITTSGICRNPKDDCKQQNIEVLAALLEFQAELSGDGKLYFLLSVFSGSD